MHPVLQPLSRASFMCIMDCLTSRFLGVSKPQMAEHHMCTFFSYKYLTHQGLRIYASLKWSFLYLQPNFHYKFFLSSEFSYNTILPPLFSAGSFLFPANPEFSHPFQLCFLSCALAQHKHLQNLTENVLGKFELQFVSPLNTENERKSLHDFTSGNISADFWLTVKGLGFPWRISLTLLCLNTMEA